MSGDLPIRVVLADDHSMVREALARILSDSGTVNVVGQASNGSQVMEIVKSTDPECVVLDYSMPGLDAPAVIESLLRRQSTVKILVLTVHENIHYAVRVLESGAHGYLIKSAAVDELVEAIKVVYDGGIYISPKVSAEVLKHLRRPKRERIGLESLSQREFDLLRILGAGKSLQQCAQQMKVSTSTASTYRARVMEKLNLESTAELIRFALEHNVVG
ncbi:MAG: response regulator transcription factor [Planctomycetaceae bacterium]|nr:response regulator transcription factor [Planctomycetaceae bacterium]